ncbi:hypothetical protein [Catenuloplanes indicus]|uniref:TetR family transcriptional regulator n=1 Tax=Catenuloplanes indicus TaxID=137267 RepID=A0AAE3W3I5_9ACTN|nr:hypothetical protein [Catenuloplanes indicus]MDQ0369128.1 hypothetical protein [Catenuloplanes indicus]
MEVCFWTDWSVQIRGSRDAGRQGARADRERGGRADAAARAFAQLLLSEVWRTNREWQQTLTLLHEEAISVIAETVSRGVDSGDLPADLDVRVASSALFGVGLVVAVDWLVFTPERPVEHVEASLLAIVRRVPLSEF